MAHAQKPDLVFQRNGRVHLNLRGASLRSTTGSRGVRISGSNAGCTMFRGSVKSTGYPLHSTVSPSLPLPCVTVCHHISIGLYQHCRLLHCKGQLKCDGTRAETRFGLSAKRTSPFKSRWGGQFSRLLAAEVCASAVVMLDIPCSEAECKTAGYPLHSPVSPSLPLPFITMCHQVSTDLYYMVPHLCSLSIHCHMQRRNTRLWPLCSGLTCLKSVNSYV